MPWDPSVKALIAFPQVIVLMTEHIEWTGALGVAFATQQAQVMGRVQGLRQLAVKSGRIEKVKQVRSAGGERIVIVSAEPDRIFVPVYNPTVVYGTWPERTYPPVYCRRRGASCRRRAKLCRRDGRARLRGDRLAGGGAALGLDAAGLGQQPDHDQDRGVHADHAQRAGAAEQYGGITRARS